MPVNSAKVYMPITENIIRLFELLDALDEVSHNLDERILDIKTEVINELRDYRDANYQPNSSGYNFVTEVIRLILSE